MSYDHERLVCDLCSEWQMLRPEKTGRTCHMTPKCGGRVFPASWGEAERESFLAKEAASFLELARQKAASR